MSGKRFKIYVELGYCSICKQTKIRIDGEEDPINCDCDGEFTSIRAAYVTLPKCLIDKIIVAWTEGEEL